MKKKKASMLSVIAYLIAIIFVSIVIFKVFTFAVERHPDIEVRKFANSYDYALNAPEEVEIFHAFPQSFFQGCGIGAVLFNVDRDDYGNIIDGSHLGVSRCGELCIEYHSTMSTVMAAMFAFDFARGIFEIVTAKFGGSVISEAGKEYVQKYGVTNFKVAAYKQLLRKKMDAYTQSGGTITRFFKTRVIRGAVKSPLAKITGKKALRTAMTEAGTEAVTRKAIKQIWGATTQEVLSTTLGAKFKEVLRVKTNNLFRPLKSNIGEDFAIRTISENPGVTKEILAAGFEQGLYVEIITGTINPVDAIAEAKRYSVQSGIRSLDGGMYVLKNIPPTAPGKSQSISSFIATLKRKATTHTGVRITDSMQKAMDAAVSQNSFEPLTDYFARATHGGLNQQYASLFLETTVDFARTNKDIVMSAIESTTIDSSFQATFLSRVIADQAASTVFSGDGLSFINAIKGIASRSIRIGEKFVKFEEAVVRGQIRTAVTGTGIGAVKRDVIMNAGFSFTELFLRLPSPGTFLGVCCFVGYKYRSYARRFALEAAQFTSSIVGGFIPGSALFQAFLDLQTLDIYAGEIDNCRNDISFYQYIKDNSISLHGTELEEKKEATKMVLNAVPGLPFFPQNVTILINYIDSPSFMKVQKNYTTINYEIW